MERRHLPWSSWGEALQDEWLGEYILESKEAGVARQKMVILCAALRKIFPRAKFVIAKRVLEVWQHELPVKQAPACPAEIAYALAASALIVRQPGMAIAVMLCFTGLLRVSEALGATWDNFFFLDHQAVLLLGKTKRGIDDRVVFTHSHTLAWLLRYRKLYYQQGQPFVRGISYSKFRYWLRKLSLVLGLAPLNLTSHSFRRGGASTMLQNGVPVSNIAVHGRWAGESSCREYLRRGELYMLRLRTQLDSAIWNRIHVLSSSLFCLLTLETPN